MCMTYAAALISIATTAPLAQGYDPDRQLVDNPKAHLELPRTIAAMACIDTGFNALICYKDVAGTILSIEAPIQALSGGSRRSASSNLTGAAARGRARFCVSGPAAAIGGMANIGTYRETIDDRNLANPLKSADLRRPARPTNSCIVQKPPKLRARRRRGVCYSEAAMSSAVCSRYWP